MKERYDNARLDPRGIVMLADVGRLSSESERDHFMDWVMSCRRVKR